MDTAVATSSLESVIVSSLRSVDTTFEPDELAFLAVTSKVEGPIRDRLAFALHKSFGREYIVAREWDRVDLAVLSRGQDPMVLLELKAMYTFDDAARYCRITELDESKTRSFAPAAEAVYSLLLATHPGGQVPAALRRVIKYDGGINSAIRRHGSTQLVANAHLASMKLALRYRNLVASGNLRGGDAYGMPVDVFYWLVRDPGPRPAAMSV